MRRARPSRRRDRGGRRANRNGASLAPAALERALDLPLRVAVGDRPALVADVLAARERELDLHATVLEVEPRRDERQPLLAYLAVEAVELAPVEQELPRPGGLVVRAVSLLVDRDLGAEQPRLALAHLGVGLRERRPARAQRLDLRPGEDDPGLVPVEQLVVVPRAAVVGDELR